MGKPIVAEPELSRCLFATGALRSPATFYESLGAGGESADMWRRAEESPRAGVRIGQAKPVSDGGEAKRRIPVVGAIIVQGRRILCTQRGPGRLEGLWEFPGGKLEPGESPKEALAREIREELGCQVTVDGKVVTTEHEYDFAVIILTTYYCSLVDGQPRLSEHIASAWLSPEELTTLTWAPADVPAVRQVQRDFS